MQTLAPPEPLAPQLWQGVLNGGAGHKAHIVQLDVAAGGTAAKHGQKETGHAGVCCLSKNQTIFDRPR